MTEFESAFKYAAIGMALVSPSGQWLKVNVALCKFLGYSETELTALDFQAVTHPDEVDLDVAQVQGLLRGEYPTYRLEKRYIRKNGAIVWGLLSVSLIRDERGEPKYFISQIQDIDRQKRSAERLELVLETSYDGYWDWNLVTDARYFSPRFWSMFGYGPGFEAERPAWRDMIFPQDHETSELQLAEHLSSNGESPYRLETRWRHRDGSTVWVICAGRVLEWDDDGKPLRMIGTHTDITALRHAQTSLLQSSKMIALGEMAAGVAHEINNPLAILMGFQHKLETTLERDGHGTPEIDGYLGKMTSTVERINKIVRGLRNFARDGGGDPFEWCAAGDLVEDALGLCREKLQYSSVELRYESADEESERALIRCQRAMIAQLILNLVSNSFHAVQGIKKPGKRWISIELAYRDSWLTLTVRDSGPGVPAEIRNKIMQPFFTTKSVGEGTGLGLSISVGVANQHGGELFLDSSQPNTAFCLRVPARARASAEASL